MYVHMLKYNYIWVLGCIYIEGQWHPYEMIFDDYDGQ